MTRLIASVATSKNFDPLPHEFVFPTASSSYSLLRMRKLLQISYKSAKDCEFADFLEIGICRFRKNLWFILLAVENPQISADFVKLLRIRALVQPTPD